VKAVGFNPVDYKVRKGAFGGPIPKDGLILGADFSGVIEKVGNNVKNFKVKDEVYGMALAAGAKSGTYAECMVISEKLIALKPKSLSFEQTAGMPIGGITAVQCLQKVGHLNFQKTVLITGASGGVGTAVRQLAKIAGATVITVDRSRPMQTEERARTVADFAFYLSDFPNGFQDLPAAIAAMPLFEKQPVDAHFVPSFNASTQTFSPAGHGASLIFDSLGGAVIAPLLNCLASNGRLVNIATADHQMVQIDLHDVYRRQLQIRGANSLYLDCSDSAAILNTLTPLFDSGELAPIAITQSVDARQAMHADGVNAVGQAYESVMKGVRGKVVLNFSEDATQ